MAVSPNFSPAERRNWGYWDGVADAERRKYAEWANPYGLGDTRHPFDPSYGSGYWAGRRGLPHPNG